MKRTYLSGVKACVLATLWILACLVTGPAAADDNVPLPRNDAFYTPPPGYEALPNGSVLRDRRINAQYLVGLLSTDVLSVIGDKLGDKVALLKKLKIDAYQVLYKSTDGHDQPTAQVVTVLVPQGPYLGAGPRPLVSYANAIDGVSDRCWPSYALRAGLQLQNVGSLPTYDTGETLVALLAGYAVSYSDYEGPHSQWAAGPQAGHAVLDSIRAVLHYAPTGLSGHSQVGLLGYSGGGGAVGWAAALHASYAPELRIVGAGIGAPLNADIGWTFNYVDSKLTSGILALGVIGLDRAYPEANVRAYLNAKGLALLDQDADACFLDGTLPHLGAGRFENYTIDPAVRFTDSAPGRFFVEANSLVKQPYVPDMPILIYGDVFDDLVGIKPANDLAMKYCQAGAQVEMMHTFTPVPTPGLALVHISGEVEGTLPSLAYLIARFNGQTPRNDCGAAAMSVWSSSVPLPYYPFITQ